MIILSSPRTHLELGETIEITIERTHRHIQTRASVAHGRIAYLQPLQPWSEAEVLRFFPESPGSYQLIVDWRDSESGSRGQQSVAFQVGRDPDPTLAPTRVGLDRATSLWAPSIWEGSIAEHSERALREQFTELLRPGFVVYDVGANLGVFSILFSRLVGPTGQVYCMEANPVCVHFLNLNLQENGISKARILPVAIGERESTVRFTINYGNTNLGLTGESAHHASKIGHSIQVEETSLDCLISEYGLRPPNLIKIDVEGSEGAVARGMRGTLSTHRPVLALELHGQSPMRETLSVLDEFSYSYVIPSFPRKRIAAEEMLRDYGARVVQILALPTV